MSDYQELAKHYKRENEQVMHYAVEQLHIDQPNAQVLESILTSKVVSQGPRWYIAVQTREGDKKRKRYVYYRVWKNENNQLKATQVELA
jgi:hypothetical protein